MVRPGPWAAMVPLRMPIASARFRASSSAAADWLSELVSCCSAERWSLICSRSRSSRALRSSRMRTRSSSRAPASSLVVADVAHLDGEGETEQQGQDADEGGGQRVLATPGL